MTPVVMLYYINRNIGLNIDVYVHINRQSLYHHAPTIIYHLAAYIRFCSDLFRRCNQRKTEEAVKKSDWGGGGKNANIETSSFITQF